MDKIYIIIFIVIPISTFGSGFLMARQLRALENVSRYSRIFVQRRLLFSIGMGFFISLMFTLILGSAAGFSLQGFFGFIGMFLLSAFCYYFGVNFGWGNLKSEDEGIIATNQAQADTNFPENIHIENSLESIKITIKTKKRWVFFTMEAFQLIFLGLCGLPILSLVAISILQNYLPESFHFLVWLLVGGLALYLFYTKIKEALEYIFDKEIIEINNLSVRVEKYGSQFSSKKEYPAENIKKITVMFLFGNTNVILKRSPFVNSNFSAFMIWHNRGLKRYRTFGRAIDLADAQRILEMVYARFPQYKG